MKIKNRKHDSPTAGKDESLSQESGEIKAGPTAASVSLGPEVTPPAEITAEPPVAVPEPHEVKIKAEEDRYLRLLADFENFRKRTLREKNDIYRMANEEFMLNLLPVLDHMDLAMEAVQTAKADRTILDGVKIVAEQLAATMKKFGMVPIEAEGQAFDPALHEAISHLASDTVPENRVIQQFRRGYLLGSKLLRPAQVLVSSGPAKASTADEAPKPEAKEE